MSQEEKNIPVEQQRLEKEQIEDMGSVYRTRGAHAIHCLPDRDLPHGSASRSAWCFRRPTHSL